jgi:hypothetical protein
LNSNRVKSPVKFTKDVYSSAYLSSLTPREFVVKKETKGLDRLSSAQKLYKPQVKMTQTMPVINKSVKNSSVKTKEIRLKTYVTYKSPRPKIEEKPLAKSMNKLQFLTYK